MAVRRLALWFAVALCAGACSAALEGDPGGQADGGDGDGAGDGNGGPGLDDREVVKLTGKAVSACGSPAGEGVDMVADGSADTKYLTFKSSAWVRLELDAPKVLTAYAITSANDYPQRDPVNWVLRGSNDGHSWEVLDARTGEDFPERFQRREFSIQPAGFYRFYVLDMENEAGGTLQLAEWELFGMSPFTDASASVPAAPAGLRAASVSRSQIDLSWQDGAGEGLYRIEQSRDGGATWSTASLVAADVTRASIAGLDAGTSYSFRVVAENSQGDSTPSAAAAAQTAPPVASTELGDGRVRYADGGYSVIFDLNATGVPQSTVDDMVEEFFEVYGEMASRFNPGAAREVKVTFDPAYEGVAQASFVTADITINPDWSIENPRDIGVITHEALHVIQAYSNGGAPGWAIEGLADYARHRYGRFNADNCWSWERYGPGQSYTDGYGVTARFFYWLEEKVSATILDELDERLRSGDYSDAFWVDRTGKTLDALWDSYAQNPAL